MSRNTAITIINALSILLIGFSIYVTKDAFCLIYSFGIIILNIILDSILQ
jgi:hypothetical protein